MKSMLETISTRMKQSGNPSELVQLSARWQAIDSLLVKAQGKTAWTLMAQHKRITKNTTLYNEFIRIMGASRKVHVI